VAIITRASEVKFRPFAWRKHLFRQLMPGPLRPLSYRILPPTDLGDIHTARKMADPRSSDASLRKFRNRCCETAPSPSAPIGCLPGLKVFKVKTQVTVTGVERAGAGLKLALSDGTAEHVDVVVLANRVQNRRLQNMTSSTIH